MRREERGWGGGGGEKERETRSVGSARRAQGKPPSPAAPPSGTVFHPAPKKPHPAPLRSSRSLPEPRVPAWEKNSSRWPSPVRRPVQRRDRGRAGARAAPGPSPTPPRQRPPGNGPAALPRVCSAFFFLFVWIFFFICFCCCHSILSSLSPPLPSFLLVLEERTPAGCGRRGKTGGRRSGGGRCPRPRGGGGCSRLGAGGGGCRCPVIAALPAARRGTQLAARDPLEV